ncbi:MAG: hypothetical protein DLM55_07400 [Acidimicrobiales bacterium]|nr:MAG: hypothetical protein DLM55_07400 [Acidimicrobiales bacterium]
MTSPRRVRKRYPKMPDVSIDDIDELPSIPLSRGMTEPSIAADERSAETTAVEQSRFALYPGKVTAAISLWQPNSDGVLAKRYDTRITYVSDHGPEQLKITVPALDFLPTGTRVNVEKQNSGRVRVHRKIPPLAKGASWKRPDIKGAFIALVVILALTAVIGVIGYLIGRSKQGNQHEPPVPSVTVQPNGSPVTPSASPSAKQNGG